MENAKETIEREVEEEYTEAIEEQKRELQEKVGELDRLLGERMHEIEEKNTLFFTCACDKTRKIPVSIDLSQENRFTCENCGSTYRVNINARPILLSNISDNKVLANIFTR